MNLSETGLDDIYLNGQIIGQDTQFSKRLIQFLDLFRVNSATYFNIKTDINIPVGAGLASSACGFAALVKALDHFYGWQLSDSTLSILGRLGSGSASRSFWQGFVEWQAGTRQDGMDSFGIAWDNVFWPEFRVGLFIINSNQKKISSRDGMLRSVLTSPFYSEWPKKHAMDFSRLKQAIHEQNFQELGEAAESNALAMHALMATATPAIVYSEPKTLEIMHKIWECRSQGLPVFFTQDAGPNLKLLYLEKDQVTVQNIFQGMISIDPFGSVV